MDVDGLNSEEGVKKNQFVPLYYKRITIFVDNNINL
jgi:hypothetical protein